MRNDLREIKSDIRTHKRRIRLLLESNGVSVTEETFDKLINELEGLHIIPNNAPNHIASFLDGYVAYLKPFDPRQHYVGAIPSDLHEGCYQLVDGVLVRDDKKREALHSLD